VFAPLAVSRKTFSAPAARKLLNLRVEALAVGRYSCIAVFHALTYAHHTWFKINGLDFEPRHLLAYDGGT
jgi:hypothetical protein